MTINCAHIIPGRITVLAYLIDELGVDPIAADEYGKTTLHAAAQANQLETVQVLKTQALSKDSGQFGGPAKILPGVLFCPLLTKYCLLLSGS